MFMFLLLLFCLRIKCGLSVKIARASFLCRSLTGSHTKKVWPVNSKCAWNFHQTAGGKKTKLRGVNHLYMNLDPAWMNMTEHSVCHLHIDITKSFAAPVTVLVATVICTWCYRFHCSEFLPGTWTREKDIPFWDHRIKIKALMILYKFCSIQGNSNNYHKTSLANCKYYNAASKTVETKKKEEECSYSQMSYVYIHLNNLSFSHMINKVAPLTSSLL